MRAAVAKIEACPDNRTSISKAATTASTKGVQAISAPRQAATQTYKGIILIDLSDDSDDPEPSTNGYQQSILAQTTSPVNASQNEALPLSDITNRAPTVRELGVKVIAKGILPPAPRAIKPSLDNANADFKPGKGILTKSASGEASRAEASAGGIEVSVPGGSGPLAETSAPDGSAAGRGASEASAVSGQASGLASVGGSDEGVTVQRRRASVLTGRYWKRSSAVFSGM